MRRIGRLLEDCNPSGFRRDLLQYFQPLDRQFRGQEGEPRRVAARTRQTCDQAAFQRVSRCSHYDRDALRCALRGADRSGAADYDDIDLRPQQIADQRGYRFDIITIMAKLVATLPPCNKPRPPLPAYTFPGKCFVPRGPRPVLPRRGRLPRRRGLPGCAACDACSHTATLLPRTAMNCRRLMGLTPRPRIPDEV